MRYNVIQIFTLSPSNLLEIPFIKCSYPFLICSAFININKLGFPLLPMALFKNFWADPFILLFLIGSLWYPHTYLQLYKGNDLYHQP